MKCLRWFRRCNATPPPAPDRDTSVRKLEDTRRALEQTRAETDYYRGLGTALRAIRRENHLAETFLVAAHSKGDRRD